MLQNRGKRLPPWGIRNSAFQPLRNQKLCFQMTLGGRFTKVAKQNKTRNKKQTDRNKQTNRQNTWRFAKHCQTFLDTWLVLATFVEIMSKASNFWKALRSAEVWLWVIQGSTKEVGLERIWKFSILPVLSLSSKTEVSSYLKLMTPTIKPYFLRDSHCALGIALKGKSWFCGSGVGLESLHSQQAS